MRGHQFGLLVAGLLLAILTGCKHPDGTLHVKINSESDPKLNEVHSYGMKKGSVVTWESEKQTFEIIFTSGNPCKTPGTGAGGANYYPSTDGAPYTASCTIKSDPGQTPTEYPYVISGTVSKSPGPPGHPYDTGDHCEGCYIDN